MLEVKEREESSAPSKTLSDLMEFLLQLSALVPQNFTNSQRVLLIVFNQGIHLVQQNKIEASKTKFDECIHLYQTRFNSVDMEILNIMFKMGENIEKLNLLDFSLYFYEKIYNLTSVTQLKEDTAIKLAVIHFKLAHYQESLSYVSPIVEQFFKEEHFVSKIFIIGIYFLNCLRLHNTQYKKTMLSLQQFVQKSHDPLVYHYGFLLNKLFST